jgi:single-strand DNA-binding protein
MFLHPCASLLAPAPRFCTNGQPIAIPFTGVVHRLPPPRTSATTGGAIIVNSFTLNAVGNLARNPDFIAKNDMSYARFCLVGNDYAGKDEGGEAREVTTSLWFVAFGAMGEALARNARKGDQLVVQARVRANNWTDKQGEKQYDHSFVVEGFRFGAPGKIKREELDGRRDEDLPRAAAATMEGVGEA